MLTKPERSSGTWVGLGILAVGIAIGALARPSRWFARPVSSVQREPFPALVPVRPAETPPENGLPTIELLIPESSAAALQRVRDAALERGIITQSDADIVPAELAAEGSRQPAEIRIKGDWTDHVDSERWSYRIRLTAGTYRGMREFSIQAPKTRGYLWEWLVHEAARREGVLAPRSTFLNVVQNGHALGVYFLEEHFERELLEAQGRREGPIVVWDESVLWSTLLDEGEITSKGVQGFQSRVEEVSRTLDPAEVRAFSERRLSKNDSLNRALHAALDQMKALRALALADQPETDRRRVLEAMDELRGRTLEDLVDVERLGRAHALLSVFQSEHGLAWHNMRFYRDPVHARLEPILFDCAPQDASKRDPVPWRASGIVAAFAKSPGYYEALFANLGRFMRSDWLDGFLAEVDADLARFEAAIRAGEALPSGCSSGEMKQRLRGQLVYLRKACLPSNPVNFEASYELTDAARNAGEGWLEVRAWATSRSPVVVEGFQFSNGGVSLAASALAPDSPAASVLGPGVVLPVDGRSALFRFPMNERLANLETVEKVTRAIRQELRGDQTTLDLDVRAGYRLLAAEQGDQETLLFRRKMRPAAEEGRPAAPTLEQALERHPFLRYDFTRRQLSALQGSWEVVGDLVLPSGISLALSPGTTLRFEQGAVLLADAPLTFVGTSLEPVVLEPVEGAPSFAGVVVLGANGRSEWTHVVVRRTRAVGRGGWGQTGAVTFQRSPVTLMGCRFEGTEAEDALNVLDTDVLLDSVSFTGCRSDAFDGDHVTGEVKSCAFLDGGADGIDVSGATLSIQDCRFERLGDKAFSIGQRSRVRIAGGSAVDVSVGVVSKDESEVEVSGVSIRARNYALAAFVKKLEYGPSRLIARGLTLGEGGLGRAIAQTGCVIELEGTVVPTEDIDVEAAYQDGVLGLPE